MNPQENNEQQAVLADRVFDGRAWHADAAVLIDGRTVRGIAAQGEVPPDYRQIRSPAGSFVAPGFIDLQVNGGGGLLLNDDPTPETMRTIARAHRRFGTAALLPTLITDTCKKIDAAVSAAHAVAGTDGVLGLHLEGPFINPARAGVHSPNRIARAEMDDLEWLRELGQGGRSLITLAPECVPEGFIRALVDCGIRVSAGHSEASAEIVMRALDEGLTGVTHLFNAMPPFQGRAPGLVGAALADNRLVAGLIVDGIHVDPVSVRAAFAAKGADGIALVTDAMPTVGGNMEMFQLVGRTISLRNGRLATEEGTLAGAHLDLASAVRNAVKLCGVPLDDALCAASSTPARFLGLEHERGALIAGARADLVALTNDFDVVACWVDGMEESERRSP
jgi:N-acetylglucosamine-6-phosphate deacetylase